MTNVTLPLAVVERAIAALRKAVVVSIAVQPALDQPYSDDPRWTPWSRWVEPMAREASAARESLAKAATSPPSA
jgi:hypothetical protein